MKKVLIISPHFPPINAPDMQRVRISLPYYRELGWEPVVLCVDEKFIDGYQDENLADTLPKDIQIHKVTAWPEKYTRRLGVGRIGFRSYYQFRKKGTQLLREQKFDLVFFSTSIFHVCALGRYWQRKFGVPYVIDMQDPWRNDFYLTKPRHQRPPKFWLNYQIDKRLEAYTMPHAAGILSVSQAYIDALQSRYSTLKSRPAMLLPFGTSEIDFQLVEQKKIPPRFINGNDRSKIRVVYMGALTKFFLPLIKAFFIAFKESVPNQDDYHFYFIGTLYNQSVSYKQLDEIGKELGIAHLITEIPQRIPYFSALSTLKHADILFIPGSTDGDYNASKIYNNILSGKPIFSIFHRKSLVKKAILETNAGIVVESDDNDNEEQLVAKIKKAMPEFREIHKRKVSLDASHLKNYLASTMAVNQVRFFDMILQNAKT